MNPCGYTHPKNKPCRLCEIEGKKSSGSGIPASKNLGSASAEKQAPVVSGKGAGARIDDPERYKRADADSGHATRSRRQAKDGIVTRPAPLTPAQKQKAYRKRGGAELRERERLRVAARRKSGG